MLYSLCPTVKRERELRDRNRGTDTDRKGGRTREKRRKNAENKNYSIPASTSKSKEKIPAVLKTYQLRNINSSISFVLFKIKKEKYRKENNSYAFL